MNKNAEIPTYNEVFNLLLLPEWLNGLEFNYPSFIESGECDSPTLIETARQFQYLYDAICAGRFNLCTACKKNYSPDFLEKDSPDESHLWIQIQFVNNAILWYNASFDILLQSIWFYYKLYMYLEDPLVLTTKSYKKILKACNREEVLLIGNNLVSPNLLDAIKELRNGMTNNIPAWANYLKHNGNIQYKEYSKRNFTVATIECKEGEDILSACLRGAKMTYNSSETLAILSIREAINTMIHYHQALVDVSKLMANELNLLGQHDSA